MHFLKILLGFDLKTNCYSKFLYLNLAEEFFFVGSCSRQAFNTFIKRKSDLDSFKCVLIPVVSCDAGIDVIWRGCEGTRAGDIVTHVLSKDYTMSDQAGRGRAGIILVFGSNYTHVILGDTGGIIKFGHNLYTRAFQIGGIKYSYCCSKLVNKRGFCFNRFLRF